MNITGIGAVSCLGPGARALFEGARQGRSGLSDGLGRVPDSFLEKVPADLRSNRALAMGWLSAKEAMEQSGWASLNEDDVLIVATTTGQIRMWEPEFLARARGQLDVHVFRDAFVHQPLSALSEALALRLGFRGRTLVVSSACSAATQAFGLAAMLLQRGHAKRALVGGVEVLCDLTMEGFRSLQLLATGTCKPFDSSRQGINLSEGAGFLCLEKDASPKTLARLSGWGMSTDGHHMTGPHPEGEGIFRSMISALKTAALDPSKIDWIHAHGTGSVQNDLAESRAIRKIFGDEQPWIASTKAIHGHALGASGALEAALVVQALREQTVLATHGLEKPDPALGLRHPETARSEKARHVLKNTLGFGGNNASVIFSRVGGET